jgi:hypothetical protein
VAKPAGRSSYIAEGPIFHTGRISEDSSGVLLADPTSFAR